MATPTTLPATFVAGNVLTAAQMNNLRGAFRVLQVVSTSKTDTFVSGAIANGADVAITGLSATITPSSTSSLILVHTSVNGVANTDTNRSFFGISLYRGATKIGIGDAAGNRSRVTSVSGGATAEVSMTNIAMMHLDNPATTSATTYQTYASNSLFAGVNATFYVNRSIQDSDSAQFWRTMSSITVMEISA